MGSRLTAIDIITGQSTLIKNNIGINLNAIGYNTLDNLIYGIEKGTNNLIVVDSIGNVGLYGEVINLPNPGVSYEVGAIDDNGHLFIMETNSNRMYTVDVNTSSQTFSNLVDPGAGFIMDLAPYGIILSSNVNITDWAVNSDDGLLYSVDDTGTVLRINQFTGLVTPLITTGIPVSSYGPIYSFSGGGIYATDNATGNIYRISINGNNAIGELFSVDTTTTENDGASCLNAILQIDFGDAPDNSLINEAYNYKTLLVSDGPRHGIDQNLILGSTITGEFDAYPNNTATGDDIVMGIQDDGAQIIPLVPIAYDANNYSFTIRVFNNTGSTANLYAWLDFNQNGIFETNEGFTTNVLTSPIVQNINVNFNKPVGSNELIGNTFIRVRLTTDNLTNTGGIIAEDTRSFGPASDGEVEDYLLNITSEPFECGVKGYRVSN